MNSLYVRLPHRAASPAAGSFGPATTVAYAWTHEGDPPRLLQEGVAAVGELPSADRLVLLLPAADVLLLPVILPPLPARKLQLALPGLVEEHLLQDASQCHIALGPWLDEAAAGGLRAARPRLLMITDRGWLRGLFDVFAGYPARRCQMLPASLCVPWPAADEASSAAVVAVDMLPPTLLPDQPAELDLALRRGVYEGYGLRLPPEQLTDGLAHAAGSVHCWLSPIVRALAKLPKSLDAEVLGWSQWIAGARTALARGDTDLCQYEFVNGGRRRIDWSHWRLPAAFAALSLIVQLIGMNTAWLELRGQQRQIDAAMRQQFTSTFPHTPVVLSPLVQMRRQVEWLRQVTGQAAPDDFLPLADRFAQAANPHLAPDAILALDYREHHLEITLKPEVDTEALRAAARQAGLSMEARAAATDDTLSGSHWTLSATP